MKEVYKSKVYTERPAYADFDAPAKFTAIQSIVAKRIKEHPRVICSYSGGSDSDIMIDIIERTRERIWNARGAAGYFACGKGNSGHFMDV